MDWSMLYSNVTSPTWEQITEYIGSPLWADFNERIQSAYQIKPCMEHSCHELTEAELLMPLCSDYVQTVYQNTKIGNGQKWLSWM